MNKEEKEKEKAQRRRVSAAYAEAILESEPTVPPTAEGEIEQGEKAEAGVKEEEVTELPKLKEGEPLRADVASLQQELEQAVQKAADYFEGWQRERADFANYKRRVERDQGQLSQMINGDIIKKYLVILDDLDRAIKIRPPQAEGEISTWADGIDLIYRKLQNILESEGVERIQGDNEDFNPILHEAISHEDSPDHESGKIIEIVQQGYKLGDRVLRPALVRVAR